MSVSRISLPAASASGVASAASSSARSMASEPRAVVTAATSAADSSELWARGRARGAVVAARAAVVAAGRAVVAARGAVAAAGVLLGRAVRGVLARGRRARGRRGAGRGRRTSRRGGRSPSDRAVLARGRGAGSGVASAASRLGAAPPSALRGAATIRAGSAPMPRTPREPGREDLEVEVPEADPERVAGGLDGLLDGLAGELLVFAHG